MKNILMKEIQMNKCTDLYPEQISKLISSHPEMLREHFLEKYKKVFFQALQVPS